MAWVMVFLGLAFAGLAVLGACSVKVFVALRGLSRELERTRRSLEPQHAALKGELGRLKHSSE
jgi:hypothetical protein